MLAVIDGDVFINELFAKPHGFRVNFRINRTKYFVLMGYLPLLYVELTV